MAVNVTDHFNCNPLESDLIGPHFKTDQGIGPKRLCNRDVRQVTRVAEQLTVLISDLRGSVRYFDVDIEVEEARARVFDLQSADYPILARQLRARRNNLLATIAMLETTKGPSRKQP